AIRHRMEDAKHALLGAVDDLDDASAVADTSVFLDLLGAQQRTIADARDFAWPRAAWGMNADAGRGAMRFLVPFGGKRDQLAVAVALGDVGEHHGRQRAGWMQLLVAAFEAAFVAEF